MIGLNNIGSVDKVFRNEAPIDETRLIRVDNVGDNTTRKTPIAVRITAGAPNIWYAGAIYRWRTTCWLRRW
jgi:hypothetical protein